MSLFVLTQQDDKQINSPVFHAGQDGTDEAIAAFTTRDSAHDYVKAAGWEDNEAIAELQQRELVQWLVAAFEGGTTVLVVDPNRDAQSEVPQPTLTIPELLEDLGKAAEERIRLPAPALPTEMESVDMLHCQQCGKLVERKSGDSVPECCGAPMTVAAHDAIERPVAK